jgi:hypothetical protein
VEDIVSKLIEEKLLTPEGAEQVRSAHASGKTLDDALRGAPGVSEEKILRFLSAHFDVPFVAG